MSESELPRIPGYELYNELGAGGMATVYLGLQKSLDRKVAIKVLRLPKKEAGDPKGTVKRFAREGRMLARLTHKNVCGIFDIGRVGDTAYIAMEYIEGGTLGDRLRRGMTAAEAIGVVVQMASALAAAHAIGIVHRDLKPANVMMRGKVPVLTDFGIARDLSPDRTEITGDMILGTPHYMSPEQIEGRAIDGRSDVYSLGAMFYELLVGRQPYSGDSMISICVQHLQAPIPELPEAFAELQPVLDSMMAKDRDERLPDMAAVVVALRNSVLDSPSLRQALRFDVSTPVSEQMRDLGFSFDGPGGESIREALEKSAATPSSSAITGKRPVRPRSATDPNAARFRPAEPKQPTAWWQRHRRALAIGLAVLVLAVVLWRSLGGERLTEDQMLALQMMSRQFDQQLAARQLVHPADDNALASLRALYSVSRTQALVLERQQALRDAVQQEIATLVAGAQFGEARALLGVMATVFDAAEIKLQLDALDRDQAITLRDGEISRKHAELMALLDANDGIHHADLPAGITALTALAGAEDPRFVAISERVSAILGSMLESAIADADYDRAIEARDRLRLLLPDSAASDAAYTAVDQLVARISAEQVLRSTRAALQDEAMSSAGVEQVLAGLRALERSAFADQVAELGEQLLRRAQVSAQRALSDGDLLQARAILTPMLSRFAAESSMQDLESRLRQAEQLASERLRAAEEAQRAGRLALDATPWAEVVSVIGPDGVERSIEGARTTPFVITLPEGRYQVTMQGPDGQSRQTAEATVNRGEVTVSELRFAGIGVDAYLQEAGYR